MSALSLYLRLLGASYRAQMQYRSSFWMLTVSQVLALGMEFLTIGALFARFGQIQGWSFGEVCVLYGIANAGIALGEGLGRGFDTFPPLVRSGEFDRMLLRPVGTVLQVAAREVQLMRVGRVALAIGVLAWGAALAGLPWTPPRVLLLLGCIVGSTCLFYGLFVLQATASFWTVEALELANTVTYGGAETGQYPLEIYRGWFRRFFTWVVPLAWVGYFPAHYLLNRPGGPPWPVQALGWMVGPLFLVAALAVWKLGERHYTSTGS